MFNSLSLLHDFDSIFDNMLASTKMAGYSAKETPEHLEMEIDVPGVKKEDASLFYDRGYLTLETKRHNKNNKRNWYVGNDYDFNNINLNLDLGVLYLKVPRKVKEEPTKINLLK